MRHRSKLAGALVLLLLGYAPGAASAAPPRQGVLVPGASLGGIRLGATKEQVRAAWGKGFGRCKGCASETWYFNYEAFTPKGAGVEFKDGRAEAVFTLWEPSGWRTTKGLRTGEPAARVTTVYGSVTRAECGTYSALVLPGRGALSVVYVVSDRVWGFALLRRGAPPCR